MNVSADVNANIRISLVDFIEGYLMTPRRRGVLAKETPEAGRGYTGSLLYPDDVVGQLSDAGNSDVDLIVLRQREVVWRDDAGAGEQNRTMGKFL